LKGSGEFQQKEKEGRTMKRILAIVCFTVFVLVPLSAQAQSILAEKYGYDIFEFSMIEELRKAQAVFVTSSSLEVSDVVSFVQRVVEERSALENNIEFVGVYGIHQEGNSARIFYRIKKMVKGTGTPAAFETSTVDLVRFTSGVWFYPKRNEYVVKVK
jgi:hypothetical protein